jgi:perosamine synthetase
MLRPKPNLIPRANWDYGISDFGNSVSGIFNDGLDMEGLFERLFNRRTLFTTSGRASLYAILKSLDLPPGSHIGVPLFCCSVVFDTIIKADLRPRFLDISPEEFNVSALDLEKKKDSLSAIIVVHMFGSPADMDSLSSVSGGSIPIIEDCAHSLFSMYKGKYAGTLSTASFFSFRSGKYVSSGEGSAILTQSPELYNEIKKNIELYPSWNLREELLHASTTLIKSKLYQKPFYGLMGLPIGRMLDRRLNLTAKSGIRLRNISKGDSTIIFRRISDFQSNIKRQIEHSSYLLANLSLKNCILPAVPDGCNSNYYQFPILFKTSEQRDMAANHFFQRGVDCAKYLDEIVDYAKYSCGYEGDCHNAEHRSKTTLLIPHYYTLSYDLLDHVKKALMEVDHLLE